MRIASSQTSIVNYHYFYTNQNNTIKSINKTIEINSNHNNNNNRNNTNSKKTNKTLCANVGIVDCCLPNSCPLKSSSSLLFVVPKSIIIETSTTTKTNRYDKFLRPSIKHFVSLGHNTVLTVLNIGIARILVAGLILSSSWWSSSLLILDDIRQEKINNQNT